VNPGMIESIREKVDGRHRLTLEEGMHLFASPDIHTLGELAHSVRSRLHGRVAYYNLNRHINYTNYCILRCAFCSFARPWSKQATDGYVLTVEEVVDRAAEAAARGATEVHIVGGLHPRLPFDYYTQMCAEIQRRCPRLHIKAFTAIEIIHFTRIARPRMTIREVLTALREAGLGSLPGGGAEIFDDRVHAEAFRNKVGQAEWFDVHRTAHELGIFTNATMLYGHIETPAERLQHLITLREHQDESLRSRPGHFNCLVPLPFVPERSDLAHLPGPTGLDSLRTLALARLLADNIPHIKAFWIMLGIKLAQVSLNWGLDDIDGTVVYYDITRRDGATTHQEMPVETLQRLIYEAGCVPVERDTLYRRVIREGADWSVES
jgi:aminodeoxyfutalosine synthase